LRFIFNTFMIMYMNRRGFTIVELVIVVTIMGILLVLGVVNLQGSQANGRDAERKADIESTAMHLETFYTSGSDSATTIGRYPSTLLTSNPISYLRDIDVKSITAPGITNPTTTFIPATNNTQTTAGVTPQPTFDQYVYQPLQSDGTRCTSDSQECRKFNLYYRLETDNTVYMVTGKNQ